MVEEQSPRAGHIIGQHDEVLKLLAEATANPQMTFVRHRHIFVDLCGHWITSWKARQTSSSSILFVLAWVLPVAPHLAFYVDQIMDIQRSDGHATDGQDIFWRAVMPSNTTASVSLSDIPATALVQQLLTVLRLLNFDNEAYAQAICAAKLQPLLAHGSRPVRYLTIAILRSYLHAADAFMESMVERYLGEDPIRGIWHSRIDIDFIFLP
jgi:midasin